MSRTVNAWRATSLVAVSLLMVAGCGSDKKESSSTTATTVGGAATTTAGSTATTTGGGGAETATGKIALLLPESKTARYETQDRPLFEAKLKALCSGCELLYSNADQDAAKQQSQAEAALTNGAKVLVVDAVDGAAAAQIVTLAKSKGVPVISYDRLITGADVDFYLSHDNEKVGVLQATALVEALEAAGKTSGDIVMINGAPTDNNAKLFKAGAHSVLDKSGFTVAAESDTIEWSADNAQRDMEGSITALGKDKIIGVYAANDGTAGGAIAAMKSAGMTPLPPVTGQDAEVAGLQRILAGEQYMTIYKQIKPLAEGAAQAAIDLLNGKKPASTTTVNNGKVDVPATFFDPKSVTKDLVKSVIDDGFWKASEVCTAQYADACKAAGIS